MLKTNTQHENNMDDERAQWNKTRKALEHSLSMEDETKTSESYTNGKELCQLSKCILCSQSQV